MSLTSTSGLLRFDERERLVGRAGGEHLRGAVLQHPLDEIARVGLIVDHQHLEPGELRGDERCVALAARRLRMQALAGVCAAGERPSAEDAR